MFLGVLCTPSQASNMYKIHLAPFNQVLLPPIQLKSRGFHPIYFLSEEQGGSYGWRTQEIWQASSWVPMWLPILLEDL